MENKTTNSIFLVDANAWQYGVLCRRHDSGLAYHFPCFTCSELGLWVCLPVIACFPAQALSQFEGK